MIVTALANMCIAVDQSKIPKTCTAIADAFLLPFYFVWSSSSPLSIVLPDRNWKTETREDKKSTTKCQLLTNGFKMEATPICCGVRHQERSKHRSTTKYQLLNKSAWELSGLNISLVCIQKQRILLQLLGHSHASVPFQNSAWHES